MTLLVAVIGQDDKKNEVITVASDRMISVRQPNIEYEGPTPKTYDLTDNCMMLSAGNALYGLPLRRDIVKELDETETKSVIEIVSAIKRNYQNLRRGKMSDMICQRFGFSIDHYYENQNMLAPGLVQAIGQDISDFNLVLELLVVGVDNEGAHLYRITNPGAEGCFDSIGFHAIGSGEEHAIVSLISREHTTEVPIKECLVNVVEAKKIGEKASGVGERTDIYIVSSKGIKKMGDDKVTELTEISELRQKGKLGEFDQRLKEFSPFS